MKVYILTTQEQKELPFLERTILADAIRHELNKLKQGENEMTLKISVKDITIEEFLKIKFNHLYQKKAV